MTETTLLDNPEIDANADEDVDGKRALPQRSLPNLLAAPAALGVVVGELLALIDCGQAALVRFPGQPGVAATRARSAISLRGRDIGCNVVLLFERDDPARPIVMGLLRTGSNWPLDEQPGHVEVDADGQRMLVSAKDELVLRCGKASITLTKAGKVVIQGSSVLSRASGSNRIKGGSVQLN